MPKKSTKQRNQYKKHDVQQVNRCRVCGHGRSFLRKFGMCRKCFREFALKGEIPGVQKASW